MIVPSKYEEMLVDVSRIYELHQAFGLFLNLRRLRILQVLESLLAFDKWCWITISDLTEVLQKSSSFRIVDRDVESVEDIAPREIKNRRLSGAQPLFLPIGPEIDVPTRLYEHLGVAILVSASRRESLDNSQVAEIDTLQAVRAGITFVSGEQGIVIASDSPQKFATPVPRSRIESQLKELLFRVKLGESLFLEDPTNQGDAARFLFQEYPREVVETELLNHLTDTDRYVRMNVLTALGLPAYSVGFVPGGDLPTKRERLEPASLSVLAMEKLLEWADTERDPGVLDYLICALKIQNYEGRLRGFSPTVAAVVRNIIPRLKDEQTVKDSKELLHELLE